MVKRYTSEEFSKLKDLLRQTTNLKEDLGFWNQHRTETLPLKELNLFSDINRAKVKNLSPEGFKAVEKFIEKTILNEIEALEKQAESLGIESKV